MFAGNICIGAAQQNRKEFNPPYVSSRLCSLHIIERGTSFFPLYLRHEHQDHLFTEAPPLADGFKFNLSEGVRNYLGSIAGATMTEGLSFMSQLSFTRLRTRARTPEP